MRYVTNCEGDTYYFNRNLIIYEILSNTGPDFRGISSEYYELQLAKASMPMTC